MAKQSMFDDPQSRSFAIRILNEEDAVKGDVTVSRNIIGVLDKDFIIQAAVAVDFLPPQGKEGVFYLLPDDTLWLYSGGLYICVSADVDKDYVDAKFNAAVATSKNYTDSKLDHTVVRDVALSQDASTMTMTEEKENLKTGDIASEDTAFPVASTTQAGIMNAATYQSVVDTQALANNLLEGAVVIEGLSETPTQAQLTSAWLQATGKTFVLNRAYIWSPEYSRGYTFFDNADLWYVTSSGGGSSITVVPFTNAQAGIIKGAAVDGQVFAEANGTGSVYGWDALKTRVVNTETALENKVDKVAGKGLSTEDYTTAEKTKLASVETGATKVILDNTLDSSSDNGVKNKVIAAAVNELSTSIESKASQSDLESLENRVDLAEGTITTLEGDVSDLETNKVDKVAGKGLSTEDYTTAEKTKLDGIQSGANKNVQSDWNITNANSDAFIKNKPTNVSTFVNDAGYLTDVPSEYITESELTAYNYQTSTDVATAIAGKANTSDLAAVATSGDYEDLTNTPDVPALYGSTGQNNDGAMTQKATSDALTSLNTTLSGRIGDVETGLNNKANTADLADVAFSGSYTDLLNKPAEYVLPTASSAQLGGVKVGAGLAIDGNGVLSATGGGQADSVAWGHITGTLTDQTDITTALGLKANSADLATVATSGDYTDLINTPTPYSLPKASASTLGGIKVGDNLTIDNDGKLSVDGDFQTLYSTTGQNTDGSMTQKATTDALAEKADVSDIPTQTSDLTNDSGFITRNVDDLTNYTTSSNLTTLLAAKANTSYVDTELTKKADKTDLDDYTKTEDLADVATSGLYSDLIGSPSLANVATSGDYADLTNKPNLATVATSGSYNDLSNKPTIPTVPTDVSAFNNDAGYLVEDDITTLRSTVSTHTGEISALESGKVDKVSGKGLSTNDYTTTEKDKLAGIAAGAEANVQSDWNQTNSSADDFIKNKPSIPVKVSDLTNDSGFITNAVNDLTNYYTKTDTYTKTEVNSLIASIPDWTVVVVQTLPATGEARTIYLVPSAAADDNYDEYIWIESLNDWDKIGDTKIDLTDYYTKTEVDTLLADKQHTLTQGTGISISNNTISVNTNTIATKSSVDTLAGRVTSAEGDIDTLESGLSTAQSNIGQLQTDLGVAEGKLATIENGAEVNVQADWNQTSNSADDYIKNKPAVTSLTTRTGSGSAPTAVNSLTIAGNGTTNLPYAFPTLTEGEDSWSYIRIPSFTTQISQAYVGGYIYDGTEGWWSGKKEARLALYSDLAGKANTADLATVATSGSYNDLLNKPDIPAATSDLINDSNFVSDANYVHIDNNFTNALKSKLDGIAAGAEVNVQSDWNQADSTADDYIKNKPSVPVITYTASTETLNIL